MNDITETESLNMGETNVVELDVNDEGLQNPGVLSYALPESVCGEDTRSRVSPATNFPYYWTCSLRMEIDGGMFIGSGWLCNTGSTSYDVVATAGHCVFGNGKFATSMQVIPGRDENSAPWGTFDVATENLRASANWQSGGGDQSDFDYGAILIPKTGILGAMGVAVMSDQDLEDRVVTITGYPGDKPSGTLWTNGGPVTATTNHKIRYMSDTAGGQSGCPAYTWSDENIIRAVGIHAYGGCPNASVRITAEVFNDLVAWGNS